MNEVLKKIRRLSLPELVEILKEIAEEIEIRCMELSGEE